MKRRELFRSTLASGAVVASGGIPEALSEEGVEFSVVDTNVSLFHWPFRRLPLDETKTLVTKMRSLGISNAWAGSFEGLIHRDLASVNYRLSEACSKFQELAPVGSVNPKLPGWRSVLKRCQEEHSMRAIRLHPNYHGYTLDDSDFLSLLEVAADSGLLVQIAASMEDVRTQAQAVQVADVNFSHLPGIMGKVSNAVVQILNAKPRAAELKLFGEVPNLFFDTARVDGTDGVSRLQSALPTGRVLFGTHAPFLIPEAALIRSVHESGFDDQTLSDILGGNAMKALHINKG